MTTKQNEQPFDAEYYRGRDAYLDEMLKALDDGFPIDIDEMWHMIDRIDTEQEAKEQRGQA